MKNHIEKVHNDKRASVPIKKIPQRLKAVVNDLNLERKFVCEFCDHRYTSRISLKHHMKMKHDVTLPELPEEADVPKINEMI